MIVREKFSHKDSIFTNSLTFGTSIPGLNLRFPVFIKIDMKTG